METGLYETLTGYCRQEILPMHMPGHKRNPSFVMENPYGIDVTEVDGMDDLHHPEGMIRRRMDWIAEKYHSEQSYFLINGSTGGILSAVAACCRHGDRIAVARNCHKSVYHAIRLLELRPVYIYPEETGGDLERLGIPGIISEQAVERVLRTYEDIRCVILVSPTYEGIVSPIREIAEVTARYRTPLVVDEAHGAHFNWHPSFPETAVEAGADLVVESLHKTLPSLTQTAVLHACFERISKERLEWCLQTFQSSSPSYVLMAGIDQCFAYIEREGEEAFETYVNNLRQFEEEMKRLERLYLFESPRKERSKIVIAADRAGMSGKELAERLRTQYRIETEMNLGDYCIAMTSVCDGARAFERLGKALKEIDASYARGKKDDCGFCSIFGRDRIRYIWQEPERAMYSYEAAFCCRVRIPLEQAEGRAAAEDIILYPPGIPLLVQGEIFSRDMIRTIRAGIDMGYAIYGVENGCTYAVETGGDQSVAEGTGGQNEKPKPAQ